MYFIQFYSKDLLGDTVEAIGDRSVIIVDGRQKHLFDQIGQAEAKKRGYLGYSVHRGLSFSQSECITPYKELENGC